MNLAGSGDPRIPDILLAAFAKITPGLDIDDVLNSDGHLATSLIAAFVKFDDKRSIKLINEWSEEQLESLYHWDTASLKTLKDFLVCSQ